MSTTRNWLTELQQAADTQHTASLTWQECRDILDTLAHRERMENLNAAAVTRVETLHVSSEQTRGVGRHSREKGGWTPYCEADGEDWPCDTVNALTPTTEATR